MTAFDFNVLIIDDDEDDFVTIRDLLADNLRSRYHLTWKSSYKDGLEALQRQKFDVCLLDFRLGAETGLDLLRETHGQNLSCPIILLTGQGDFDIDVAAMQTGAADYLIKGQFTAPLLDRSIRYAMKHALDKEELRANRAQILQQDRLASLGLLASSLAHEIGTPMGIIRSRAEMVVKRFGDNSALKDNMTSIIFQIDKVTKLVQSLLNIAREKRSDYSGAVDLKVVIDDVLSLVQHELNRKNIDLELKNSDSLQVKAEEGPLGQVLLNLLVNAIHAIEEAKKRGRTEGHKIAITVAATLKTVDISIEDTGVGIAANNLPQIFKPFFTTKEIGQGTGLGLATSYKLIQSWGGTISVSSEAQTGAKFTVHLLTAKG